ncbi:GNAT family N-acetyltransferase [Paenibacillus sp. FJAT-26967]|uniref:GNAT family N-acetyltransferase n=1 Tax=Paenibacillus sp. FJAT-26967 TaxID=1729690 RepID=UPI000839B05F|nr:GNAT family N-acetyltransferase [Paenibacillus sp. FJAT-26967]
MEIRLVQQEEMQEAAELADSIFRDSEQISMAQGFPNLFSSVYSESLGAFDNGRLVSFMGLLPGAIRIGRAQLYTYSLGSVCTHTDSRGKGVAGDLFTAVRERVEKAGASLLLVSGTRSLYTRAGCRPFGLIRQYTLLREHAARLKEVSGGSYTVRPYRRGDLTAMHKLAAARVGAYEQSIWDLGLLIEARAYGSCVKLRHQTYIAERNGVPAAFLVAALPEEGLGQVREGIRPQGAPIMMEWAGEAGGLAAMLAAVAEENRLKQFFVPIAVHEQEVHHLLDFLPVQEQRNMGTVLILDSRLLLEQLRPYLNERSTDHSLGDRLVCEPAPEDGVTLQLPGLPGLELTGDEWTSLLFDCSGMPQHASEEWRKSLGEVFPLPFPHTAGLNYI